MENKENDLELIEKYFDLLLSEEEGVAFEKRAAEDKLFASKIEIYKESINILTHNYKDIEESERIQKWKNIISGEKYPSNKLIQWRWIGGIAAGFLILVSLWSLFNTPDKVDLNILVKNAWDKKVGFDYYVVRNGNRNDAENIVINAYKAYEEENYPEAINILKGYTSSQIFYEDALLIRALSKYKTGNIEIAIETLDTLASYPTGKFNKEALWYKGLIYLDINDVESAKNFLVLPVESNSEIKLRE